MASNLSTPRPVTGKALKDYFQDRTHPIAFKPGFYVVKKDLKAFKKVQVLDSVGMYKKGAVANLILPRGAVVFAPQAVFDSGSIRNERKMRASFAKVESIADTSSGAQVSRAVSLHRHVFEYKPKTVIAPNFFDMRAAICSGGIHFFLNVDDAYYY